MRHHTSIVHGESGPEGALLPVGARGTAGSGPTCVGKGGLEHGEVHSPEVCPLRAHRVRQNHAFLAVVDRCVGVGVATFELRFQSVRLGLGVLDERR